MSTGADGYRVVDPGDFEPSAIQVAQAREFLEGTDLPFGSQDNFDQGIARVSAMIAESELTLENSAEGLRYAQDLKANEKIIVVLAEKLKDHVAITLHCLEAPAAQILIDGHMGYTGNN
ncbi:MAG TPA: hypothetical protein VG964_01070 [Candidatus Saccharimonadales bacterium]|nr:hypothetical protein [Candidatus Saccharimonadales bacterium]